MIEGVIRTFLLSFTSTVTPIFGNRIYSGNIPEGTSIPSVVIYRISDTTTYIDEIQTLVIQVSNFANVYSDVITHSELIRSKLKGYKGEMGAITISSINAGNSVRLYDTTLKRWMSTTDYQIVLI